MPSLMAAVVAFSCAGARRATESTAVAVPALSQPHNSVICGRHGRDLGGSRSLGLRRTRRCGAGAPTPPRVSADDEYDDGEEEVRRSIILDPSASPFQILGLDPPAAASSSSSYSAAQIKAAFRARVKEFHPDVYKNTRNADLLIKRVIEAYEYFLGPTH